MNSRIRSLLVFAALWLLYAAILVLIAQPIPHFSHPLPSATTAHNIPYFLYLRAMQALFGMHAGVVMAANGVLMLAVCGLVFRAGWSLADSRYRLLSGAVAVILFELNPLVIVLPLTLGFLGGYLLVPLFLLVFVCVMLAVDHWSAFMRAIVLGAVWSLFLWIHLPTAIIVLAAMIPWVLYNRRPTIALGTFVAVFLLGTILFSILWALGCVITHRWALLQNPFNTLQSMWGYMQQGVASAGSEGSEVFKDRVTHIVGWFSPFWVILGLWVSGKTLRHMFLERRAAAVDLAALISWVVLGVVLLSPGKDILPGAWYLVMIAAMWSPLIAKEVATKENFFTRPSRLTFSAGFIICSLMLWLLRTEMSAGSLDPDAGALFKLGMIVCALGALGHFLLKKYPFPFEKRMQSYLSGATLAYFLVMDSWLLR